MHQYALNSFIKADKEVKCLKSLTTSLEKERTELLEKNKQLEAIQKEHENRIEELGAEILMEQEEVMKFQEKSEEWHKRRVFELGMKEYSRITELRLKIQELENALTLKDELVEQLSKPSKLQQFKKSVRNSVNKVKEKTQKVQEKFNAYILQKSK